MSIDRQMDKEDMVHIYYGTHVHGTQWNTSQPLKRVKYRWPFAATWTQLEIITRSQSDRQVLYDITYTWNLKQDSNESMKHRRTMETESRLVAAKAEREQGKRGLRIWNQQM